MPEDKDQAKTKPKQSQGRRQRWDEAKEDKDKEKMTEEDKNIIPMTSKAQLQKNYRDRRNDEGGDEAQLTVYRRL